MKNEINNVEDSCFYALCPNQIGAMRVAMHSNQILKTIPNRVHTTSKG
jgi:hypothetical protein